MGLSGALYFLLGSRGKGTEMVATTTTALTLDTLEELANGIVADGEARRERLRRMIHHYCRIIAAKEPERFRQRALRYGDEDGHWDNSYPPSMRYADHNGIRSIKIEGGDWTEVATESGFYYHWEAVTSNRGIYADRHGDLYGADYSGVGAVGQYAAHPGNCGVDIRIEYDRLDDDEISTTRLVLCPI